MGQCTEVLIFFQFVKEAKEYLEVNENILTTTEGYGTQIYADDIIQVSRIIAFRMMQSLESLSSLISAVFQWLPKHRAVKQRE